MHYGCGGRRFAEAAAEGAGCRGRFGGRRNGLQEAKPRREAQKPQNQRKPFPQREKNGHWAGETPRAGPKKPRKFRSSPRVGASNPGKFLSAPRSGVSAPERRDSALGSEVSNPGSQDSAVESGLSSPRVRRAAPQDFPAGPRAGRSATPGGRGKIGSSTFVVGKRSSRSRSDTGN
jgi:hypothetical protein